uniref:Uncharacterized protein n=1 Tax=Arion vulgaris TaxID=1028688 RepID=A0A0B7ACY2_9EUPU
MAVRMTSHFKNSQVTDCMMTQNQIDNYCCLHWPICHLGLNLSHTHREREREKDEPCALMSVSLL